MSASLFDAADTADEDEPITTARELVALVLANDGPLDDEYGAAEAVLEALAEPLRVIADVLRWRVAPIRKPDGPAYLRALRACDFLIPPPEPKYEVKEP